MQALLILSLIWLCPVSERGKYLSLGLQGLLDRPQLLLKWMYFQQQDPLSDMFLAMSMQQLLLHDLMPFREYKFSIVVNLDDRSEIVNISATTLSLGIATSH